MTNLRQAAQQALDAWDDPAGMKDLCVALDALRSALEQQQAEPAAKKVGTGKRGRPTNAERALKGAA